MKTSGSLSTPPPSLNNPSPVKFHRIQFVTEIPARDVWVDKGQIERAKPYYLVKHKFMHEDNTTSSYMEIVNDYKRTIYVDRKGNRNPRDNKLIKQDHKECEDISKLTAVTDTMENLPAAALRLSPEYKPNLNNLTWRDINMSPYIFGADVLNETLIKEEVNGKLGPNDFIPNTVMVLDIENNPSTNEVYICTVGTYDYLAVFVTKQYIEDNNITAKSIREGITKHIPDSKIKKRINDNIDIYITHTEAELIRGVFDVVNDEKLDVDILTGWNVIKHDMDILRYRYNMLTGHNLITRMVSNLKHVKYKDSWIDISVGRNDLRYYDVKYGRTFRITEDGVRINLGPQAIWDNVISSTSYKIIDAQSAFYYIRLGLGLLPGGYSLDNVLKSIINHGKLTFKELHYKTGSLDWHIYMQKHRKFEYIIYNIWDVMGLLELNLTTNDLDYSIELLSGYAPYTVFNSDPKIAANNMHFFYLNKGLIMGTHNPNGNKDGKMLGLDDWVIALSMSLRTKEAYKKIYFDSDLKAFLLSVATDMDKTGAYPHITRYLNISKRTTKTEILTLKVGDRYIEGEELKELLVSMVVSNMDDIETAVEYYGLPAYPEVDDLILEYL